MARVVDNLDVRGNLTVKGQPVGGGTGGVGLWKSSVAYSVNDQVVWDGILWNAGQASTNLEPSLPTGYNTDSSANNDLFANAKYIVRSGNDWQHTYPNIENASTEVGEPAQVSGWNDTIWYALYTTNPSGATISLSTTASTGNSILDTHLEFFTGPWESLTPATGLGGTYSPDNGAPPYKASWANLTIPPEIIHYLRVKSYSNRAGTIVLDVTGPGVLSLPTAWQYVDYWSYVDLVKNKGDLIVGTGSLPATLPAGTNGQVLTADSVSTGGVKWSSTSAVTLDSLSDVNVGDAVVGDGLVYSSSSYTYTASTNYVLGTAVTITSPSTSFGAPQSLATVDGGAHKVSGAGSWVMWDFGIPTMLSGFRRTGMHASNYANSLRIEYSDDLITWTQHETFSGLTTATVHKNFVDISQSHRWWRYVLITYNGSGDELDAFEFALTTKTPAPAAWVTAEYPSNTKALTDVANTTPNDGDVLTYKSSSTIYWPGTTWQTGATLTSNGTGYGAVTSLDVIGGGLDHRLDGDGNWVKWDFGSPKRFGSFRRYGSHSGNYATTIKFQYSDDDSIWTDLETFSGLGSSLDSIRYFADRSQNHRYWRYIMVNHAGVGDELDAFFFGLSVPETLPGAWTPAVGGGSSGITVVEHGTNGAMARPSSPVVYWVGTATPTNALAYDFWKDS